MKEVLLEIKDLRVEFSTFAGVVRAVDVHHLQIYKGESLGLVGETGCGKTMTALALCRLIPGPRGRITSGQVIFAGEDLMRRSEQEMRRVRGARIAYVFQDPSSSLNPVFPVGELLTRIIMLHRGVDPREARRVALSLLEMVRLPCPAEMLRRYPHELSGGMRQRVNIAMALSCNPALLVADEPTTALDVTIEAQILRLLAELRDRIEASILLITHDLGVVAQLCERVAVMYAGAIVEVSPVRELFFHPLHPYTRGLLEAIPRPGSAGKKLTVISGSLPDPIDLPRGCRFHPRCPRTTALCDQVAPRLVRYGAERLVACHAPLVAEGGGVSCG